MEMNKKKFRKILLIFLISISLPATVLLVLKRTSFFNRAFSTISGTKANLVINLSNSVPFQPPWGYFSQGGEQKNGMLGRVVKPMSVLKPKYIRIDHIYDFYETVTRNESGILIFNWSKLDSEISAIIKTGARPFISLSYMPSVISSGTEVDIPNSWIDWSFVVKNTVEHISGKGGLNIPNVYYEVWNEPDLFGNFKLTGPKNYLTLYQYAEAGAVSAKDVQPFKLGGPATTGLYKSWFNDFLSYVQKNKLRLDFYSWHRYSKLLTDFENDDSQIKEWVLKFPEFSKIELLITESGHDTKNEKGYDNSFSAIHTMAVYATVFQKIPQIYLFEIKDGPGPEKYWGRWGIMTNENFGEPEVKPRYKSIEFLNRISGNFYPIYGQGSWVKAIATTNSAVIRTLIVNYDPYGNHIENVPVTFVNLPAKSFTFRRIDFLGGVSESKVNLNENNWSTKILMSPNSAAIFEIIP